MKFFIGSVFLFLFFSLIAAQDLSISEQTEECLGCHESLHPGLVADWRASRHAQMTPALALEVAGLEKRMSATQVADSLQQVVVGCYECHSLNGTAHQDNFEHNGFQINVVVSPKDCATCHPQEEAQYAQNLMSFAYTNLVDNPLYRQLMHSVNGNYSVQGNELVCEAADEKTEAESCLYCHGTRIEVQGMEERETEFGDLSFPILKGWPNQGVGRINPDGSHGSCSACHTRHRFSIAMARKPATCAECHKGPDVPAYKIYTASKHGNLYAAEGSAYDFEAVPWVVGKDFTAPTCATCHAALLVNPDGDVLAERTHRFNDRLAWRLFGVPYAHPHPKNADLRGIKNKQGLPLLVELDGTPVEELVISPDEQQARNKRMQQVCAACHSTSWISGHFARLEQTIRMTNGNSVIATNLLATAWQEGLASGIEQNASIFDEEIERMWADNWLFYANSTRFASAMGGGGDYGVFAGGRYQQSQNLIQMQAWLQLHRKLKK